MNNTEYIYEKLRETIEGYSVGLSPTKSGKEIKILQRLFTAEEAEIYMAMSRSLKPVKDIASRLNLETDYVAEKLETMTKKGVTIPATRNGVKFYSAAPFMHGFFEHQIARPEQDPALPPLFEDYIMKGFIPRRETLRTVPIKAEIENENEVPILPSDDVRKIIMSKERIGLFKCACAHHGETVGKDCDNPKEVCLAFDFYAEYSIEGLKIGRWITRDEALKVIDEAEKAGLVHHTGGDYRNTECICNCCPHCCVILRMIKRLPRPAKSKSSNYTIEFREDRCNQCLICMERCPMEALTEEGETISINYHRCIGCGLCTTTCDPKALTLQIKPDDKIKGPPKKCDFMRSSLDFEEDMKNSSGN